MKNLRTNSALFGSIQAKDSNGLHLQDDGGNGIFIKDGGFVGIGTTNPDTRLHIEGNNFNRSVLTLYRTSTTAGENNDPGIQFKADAGANNNYGLGAIYFKTNEDGNTYAKIRAKTDDSTGTSGRLEFTASTDAINNASDPSMVIKSNGNVGIGATNPGSSLHVAGAIETIPVGTGVHIGTISADGDRAALQLNAASGGYIDFSTSGTDFLGRILYDNTNNYMRFDTNSGERMRISSTGNVGIGTKNPGAELDVDGDIRMRDFELLQSGSACLLRPYVDSRNCFIYSRDGSSTVRGAGIDYGNGFAFRPSATDTQDLGIPTRKWGDIYAANTVIQTSDRELKQDIKELSEAETRVAQTCKVLLRKYRWKSSVEEKGDEARIHFGIIAQDLEAAFAAEGLDAGRYGMFVKNTWWTADRVTPAVKDEGGNEVSPEETVTDIFNHIEDAPEGAAEVTQRGVRYSELLAFIIAAI